MIISVVFWTPLIPNETAPFRCPDSKYAQLILNYEKMWKKKSKKKDLTLKLKRIWFFFFQNFVAM